MDKGSARRDSDNDSNLKYTVKKHKNTGEIQTCIPWTIKVG